MKALVTGGAGFVGCHVVRWLLAHDAEVVALDNLSRPGVQANLAWLEQAEAASLQSGRFTFLRADVRDAAAVCEAAWGVDRIYHLAAQVAVTTSVQQPRHDFEVNALGTFNVLEAARASRDAGQSDPIVLYASTNKVYGGMDDVGLVEEPARYRYRDSQLDQWGVSEAFPLDFHSPYGCSKGTGDQYVRDYYRIYGLRTIVFRQGSLYGPRQFGTEDQAWIAYFLIAAFTGRSLTIYGDGKQVRDVLWIDDLLTAYEQAAARPDRTAGQVYNLGGGPQHTSSIWAEFAALLTGVTDRVPQVVYSEWRPGDQRIYVSDIRKAAQDFGWQPTVNVETGVQRLADWIATHRDLFNSATGAD